MKTQYFRRPKPSFTPVQGIIALVIVVVFLIVFILRLAAPSVFVAVFSPVWQLGTFITGHAQLENSAATLEAQVAALTAENETLTNQNRILSTKASADTDAPSAHGVRAGVIARPPLAPYDVLIISKGSDAGVYTGMRAFAKDIPVGTVESVSAGSARIVLFSAAGRASEGWVGEKHVPITLKGLGAGAFDADVPREAAVAEGDMVYLPGPGALPVGTVVSIESHASSPRATLTIRPYANPFTLTEVSLVASPAP